MIQRSWLLDDVARWARPIAAVYLALPVAIFFGGYLRWPYAVGLLAGLGLMLWRLLADPREVRGREGDHAAGPSIGAGQLLFLLLAGTVFLSVSGVGGVGRQEVDWPKHNAILGDLVSRTWPVTYEVEGGATVPLCYYIAYYLPAAVVGKALGWSAANLALFAWSWVGLSLAMLWFVVLVRRAGAAVVLLFLVFSGMDALGHVVWGTRSLEQVADPAHWSNLEWWAFNWQYSSHAAQLFWVPHQALASWLATSLIVDDLMHARARERIIAWGSLVALWSPFVLIGLLPLGIAAVLAPEGRRGWRRLADFVSVSNGLGLVVFAVTALYFLSRLYPVPLESAPNELGLMTVASRAMDASEGGQTCSKLWIVYGLFLLLEVGVYLLLVATAWRRLSSGQRSLLISVVLVLPLWPLYRYGHYNDLTMRASLPSLFVLALLVGQTLFGGLLRRPFAWATVTALAIGSLTVAVEWSRHRPSWDAVARGWSPPPYHALDEMATVYPHLGFETFLRQYVGSPESPFFQVLAKPAAQESRRGQGSARPTVGTTPPGGNDGSAPPATIALQARVAPWGASVAGDHQQPDDVPEEQRDGGE